MQAAVRLGPQSTQVGSALRRPHPSCGASPASWAAQRAATAPGRRRMPARFATTAARRGCLQGGRRCQLGSLLSPRAAAPSARACQLVWKQCALTCGDGVQALQAQLARVLKLCPVLAGGAQPVAARAARHHTLVLRAIALQGWGGESGHLQRQASERSAERPGGRGCHAGPGAAQRAQDRLGVTREPAPALPASKTAPRSTRCACCPAGQSESRVRGRQGPEAHALRFHQRAARRGG